MSAEEILRSSELGALENNQIISHVSGKKVKISSKKGKIKTFSASLFIVAIIGVFAAFFSSGNIIPSAISERLIEETDVQYADGVESKKLVFREALASGTIPEDTANIMRERNVIVNGNTLEFNGKTITADNFIETVSTDPQFYNIFTEATYGRAAYYYDEAANKVFKRIGTNRNNFTSQDDFEDVMEQLMQDGSDININSVAKVKKTRTNPKTGKTETYYAYDTIGSNANSATTSANNLIEEVRQKNPAASTTESALITADTLRVADTISQEQRSSLFYATFMENISKMKAGEGNESKINEAMNYLYESKTINVVDTTTGETIEVTGTPLDSPSLYAILSGKTVDPNQVTNYSTERALTTVKNQLNLAVATDGTVNNTVLNVIKNTVASTTTNIKSTIGRFISSGIETATSTAVAPLVPTISSSLIENSFKTLGGIATGELLVEGAINVGKSLAISGSGATAGDAAAITAYQNLTTSTLALDAAADRLNRSPFDITSKNTFLGSIFYKLAVSMQTSSLFTTIASLTNLTTNIYADSTSTFLTNYGTCDSYSSIGAVGSAGCSTIATFDTTTLNNTFNDPGFIAFVNQNTTLNSNGTRTINRNSVLADFILYNNERTTPLGTEDGSILKSLQSGSETSSFVSDFVSMIESFLGSSESDKRIATGAAFVNSSTNPDWNNYKYAQRYVSLARATSALRQYTNDKTAYQNIKFFEGSNNPVIAFLENYYVETSTIANF